MQTNCYSMLAIWSRQTLGKAAGICLAALFGSCALSGAAKPDLPVVQKWSVFEKEFTSGLPYTSPLQQASLTVTFHSPVGDTTRVPGFWDGGRSWRVRFAPDTLGRWSYETSCSDPQNSGLHNQSGQFLCSASLGLTTFQQHGPVQVVRGKRFFQYADGTPFYWAADVVWEGARKASGRDWHFYGFVRNSQGFNAAVWSVGPGTDFNGERAVTGFHDQIGINLSFFREMDSKVETLSRLGLLSVICPLAEMEGQPKATRLTEEQAILLARYIVARWGAYPVAWMIAFDVDPQGQNAARWKRIGRSVFSEAEPRPVLVHTGSQAWLLDDFRNEPWVNAFGVQVLSDTTEDALKWLVSGPLAGESLRNPPRPVIPFTPLENSVAQVTNHRFDASDIRHASYWGQLLNVPAGFGYGAAAVADWDQSRPAEGQSDEIPLWHKSLFLPGAKNMGQTIRLMSSLDYWQLRSNPRLLAEQPGQAEPAAHVAAAAADRAVAVIYIPQEGTVSLKPERIPEAATFSWFDPRSGQMIKADAKPAEESAKFTTPGNGDWVLMVKQGRR